MIPYGRQDITDADLEAVRAVLLSDYLTTGPAVDAFEAKIAAAAGVAHAIAMNSATSALHVACATLGLGPGDTLWTQPNTFVASANCGLYCGAGVDFVDIDPRRFTMCPDALAEKLERAEMEGRLPKVVVPVHMCGQPADMDAIGALKRRYGFHLIEDASHAIGAEHKGRPVGSEPDTDVTVFSFHPVKIVTSGEGGAAVTRNPDLAARMALLRAHGITRDPARMTSESDGPWYYQQVDLGWNYRITDIHAALGASQMDRLAQYVDRRHVLARRYDTLLADLPVETPWRDPDSRSAFHLYVIRLDAGRRRPVFEAMRAAGIGVNVHYIPVHLQPWYRDMGFGPGDFPNSESYYEEAISIPLYPQLTEDEQDRVVRVLRRELRA
ncbi:UDP-4-amino-4,6-dideoxy-N-acetyl-beta-L-altrosamine transaminase [uncultured Sulfitobacter sp.]|uniref:UDP-4-amino-4, 6-dideoxy-N-acetyl-beta-L-altrosamine transaminase n=1 Tax=uncultured Sulfitobacter sp. TaxID=191468 RepID=UPI002606CC33|nr:UDP-4-amino-4,6-dideoxy-N-acetyl-beta-L-altrosamine transaminase [uncultured Sulfitobacter sp.]